MRYALPSLKDPLEHLLWRPAKDEQTLGRLDGLQGARELRHRVKQEAPSVRTYSVLVDTRIARREAFDQSGPLDRGGDGRRWRRTTLDPRSRPARGTPAASPMPVANRIESSRVSPRDSDDQEAKQRGRTAASEGESCTLRSVRYQWTTLGLPEEEEEEEAAEVAMVFELVRRKVRLINRLEERMLGCCKVCGWETCRSVRVRERKAAASDGGGGRSSLVRWSPWPDRD